LERKKVSEIGERRLVELISSVLGVSDLNLLPHPDDAVAFKFEDKVVVAKTDAFVKSTDMPPGMTFYQAGWKTVVMNVSDFAAKGAVPKFFLTALCVPRDFKVKGIVDIMQGIKDAASQYDVTVLGGDTGEAAELVIAGFMIGTAKESYLVSRKGVSPGDLLAVTGDFGYTGAALKVLIDGLEAPPDLSKCFKDALFNPKARLKEGQALAKSGAVSACIDSSDGLLASLRELMHVNRVGFVITKLPFKPEVAEFAKINNISIEELVLNGGEEYELVLTVKPDKLECALKHVKEVGGNLYVIGKAIEEPKIVIKKDGEEEEIKGEGYQHFK